MIEMHKLTNVELKERLSELKSTLFNLRFQQATGQIKNPLEINLCKKEIARVFTIIRERELNKEHKFVKSNSKFIQKSKKKADGKEKK